MTALAGFIGERFPQGAPSVAINAIQRQADALLPLFQPLLGFGDIAQGTSIPEFFDQNIGKAGAFDPRDVVRRSADLFGRSDLSPGSQQVLESLQPTAQRPAIDTRNPSIHYEHALKLAARPYGTP